MEHDLDYVLEPSGEEISVRKVGFDEFQKDVMKRLDVTSNIERYNEYQERYGATRPLEEVLSMLLK